MISPPRRFLRVSLAVSTVLALGACGGDPVLSDRDGGIGGDAEVGADAGRGDAAPPQVDAGPECYGRAPRVPASPAEGAWNPGYGTPGAGGDLPNVEAIAFGEAGAVYIGGEFTSVGYAAARNVARWTAGAGWTALGEGLSGRVVSLAVAPGGDVFAAYAGGEDPWQARNVARWDGTSWSDIAVTDDPELDEHGWPLEWDAIAELQFVGATLYVVGSFEEIGGAEAAGVARWDGTTWSGYAGFAPDGTVEAISATSEDDVCVGGSFRSIGLFDTIGAACWNGTEWQPRSLPLSIHEGFFDLTRDPADGSLVGVGEFMLEDPSERGGSVARWVGDHWELIGGGVMSELGPGTTQPARAVVFASSGMYVAGAFDIVNPADPLRVSGVARWDGTTYHDLGGLWPEIGFGIGRNNVAVAAAAPDGSIYFGGLFTRGGGVRAAHVVRWDGTYWSALRTPGESYDGVAGAVGALAREAACSVYVGGTFRYAGAISANSIARYTYGVGYEALGDGVEGGVDAIEPLGEGRIVIGGTFTDPTGTVFQNVAYWDGARWSAMGDSLDGWVYALDHVAADNPDAREIVYAGGEFAHSGEVAAQNLAMWNGERWVGVGGGGFVGYPLEWDPEQESSTSVRAILRDPATGDLIVAGQFRRIGPDGLEAHNIARWDGEAWHAYGDGLGGMNDFPWALAFWQGRLVAAGSFRHSGTADVRFVAAWDGTRWEQVGELELGFSSAVSEVEVVGSALYIGGMFQLGDTGSSHVAVYDGTAWRPLAQGASDIVQALLAMDQGVFVGGTFDRTGTRSSVGLALWQFAD